MDSVICGIRPCHSRVGEIEYSKLISAHGASLAPDHRCTSPICLEKMEFRYAMICGVKDEMAVVDYLLISTTY